MTAMNKETDEKFMKHAIVLAREAGHRHDVPVGAVVVLRGEIIGQGRNQVIAKNDPTAHAEQLAIQQACQSLKNFRLTECTLYCTLEPCAMCAGAIAHARLNKVVFGCFDERFGAAGSRLNLLSGALLNHECLIGANVLKVECRALIHDFFSQRRSN